MTSSFNRRLKMKDTFTAIFPSYTHGEPTTYIPSITHHHYRYPEANEVGGVTHQIDRTYTHKMDFLKHYTEEILKIANMRRTIK